MNIILPKYIFQSSCSAPMDYNHYINWCCENLGEFDFTRWYIRKVVKQSIYDHYDYELVFKYDGDGIWFKLSNNLSNISL